VDEKLFYLATKAVVIHKGKVLLLRRSLREIAMPSFWDFPGGRFKAGQPTTHTTLVKNLQREVLEETGIRKIKVDKRIHVDLLHHGIPSQLDVGLVFFVYKCDLKSSPIIQLSPEHTAYKWFSPKHLPKDLIRYQKQAILAAFN